MYALNARRIAAAVATVAILATLAACGGGAGATKSAAGTGTPTLSARTATAGPVDVKVTPRAITASGARFAVELDNHEIDLDGDYARTSTLTVGGRPWANARWSGDGPSGHHRGGTLTFDSGGSASGPVELTIGGLPTPVMLRWTLPTR